MSKPANTRYRTTNWADYNASLKRRGSLSIWFDPDMSWQADRSGKRGQPRGIATMDRLLHGLLDRPE